MIAKAVAKTLIVSSLSATSVFANPAISKTSCSVTDVSLFYNCKFELFEDGQPIVSTEILVGASMPSMAMAHNVRPVTAQASDGNPGQYEFELQLEMLGEWLVVIDIFDPIRDRFQEKFMFNPDGSVMSVSDASE